MTVHDLTRPELFASNITHVAACFARTARGPGCLYEALSFVAVTCFQSLSPHIFASLVPSCDFSKIMGAQLKDTLHQQVPVRISFSQLYTFYLFDGFARDSQKRADVRFRLCRAKRKTTRWLDLEFIEGCVPPQLLSHCSGAGTPSMKHLVRCGNLC